MTTDKKPETFMTYELRFIAAWKIVDEKWISITKTEWESSNTSAEEHNRLLNPGSLLF